MAGYACDSPPGPCELIEALGGELEIFVGDGLAYGDAHVQWYEDGWAVLLHGGLPLPIASMALARGIVRWYARAFHAPVPEPPDRLAAAILIPRVAALLAVVAYDGDVQAVARAFVVPIPVAAQRMRGIAHVPAQSGEYLRVR